MRYALFILVTPMFLLATSMTMCVFDEHYTHLDGCHDTNKRQFRANDLYKCEIQSSYLHEDEHNSIW
jgi:hypothetical protein